METILQPPQWPLGLSSFVTWCLMWDPQNRPTSSQALNHEYFVDAVDPIRPKFSTPRLLGRKQSNIDHRQRKDGLESPPPSTKSSWFRKSLITRESAPAVPQHSNAAQTISSQLSPIHSYAVPPNVVSTKVRPNPGKRATWTNGVIPSIGAPMPILPTIRPISPLSNAVTAQASNTTVGEADGRRVAYTPEVSSKKIGRQLSVASNNNHYADYHRQDAERSLNGNNDLASPTNGQKESFFSHLRKRARRLSGRHQIPLSPKYDDIEATAGCAPWQSNRSSMALDQHIFPEHAPQHEFPDLDRALQSVRYSLDASSHIAPTQNTHFQKQISLSISASSVPKRHHPIGQASRAQDDSASLIAAGPGPISSRTRRALQLSTHPTHRYETPDEEDELLHEALHSGPKLVGSTNRARLDADNGRHGQGQSSTDASRQTLYHSISTGDVSNPYPTPSPSAKRNGLLFNSSLMDEPATPLTINRGRPKDDRSTMWPTPPYEENEWAAAAAASIFAAGSAYR